MNQQLTDKQLVRRVLDGDDQAYRTLVERYQHMVYTLGVRMLADPELAEETAQDVFVKAYTALGTFRGAAKFSTWLYKIAYHRLLDVADRERRRRSWRGDLGTQEQQPALEDTNAGTQVRVVAAPTDVLGATVVLHFELDHGFGDDRDILSLHYLQQQSIKEVAAITGIRPGTVKVRLHRARERLRAYLEASTTGNILQNYER